MSQVHSQIPKRLNSEEKSSGTSSTSDNLGSNGDGPSVSTSSTGTLRGGEETTTNDIADSRVKAGSNATYDGSKNVSN